MCDCPVCSNHRRWLADIDPQTDEAKAALDEILGSLAQAESDAMYWQMKHHGIWPERLDA